MSEPKGLYNVDGIITCPTCNFAVGCLVMAASELAHKKAANALEKHLMFAHSFTQEGAASAVNAIRFASLLSPATHNLAISDIHNATTPAPVSGVKK